MARTDRHVNLVFQGGGVRGIAYAGALARMPEHCKVHAVAGTSAGSIVAALLAIGVKGGELRDILKDPELRNFLDEEEILRTARLKAAIGDGIALSEKAFSSKKLSWWNLWRFYRKHESALLVDLPKILADRGLHSSSRIRAWLDRVLQNKSFGDVGIDDIKIVAADVSSGSYVVYDKTRHPEKLLAEAIHASISIPIFFVPFTAGPSHYVDGGVLSNFPSYLFARGKYPTIGFRLREISSSQQIKSTRQYLINTLLTMAEAHDKQRGEPAFFKSYSIYTPPSIPSTKFKLTDQDLEDLYESGLAVGESVEWDKYSSDSPVVSFYDPKPDEALEFAISQGHKLWDYCANRERWVEVLEQQAKLVVQVQKDWSVQYDRIGTIVVRGRKPSFMGRLSVLGRSISVGDGAGTSIGGVEHICEEITSIGSKELIHIPAVNGDEHKGFVVFYTPPIADGQGPRTFHTGFKVPGEFAKSVAKGKEDQITYSVAQAADDHRLHLTIRIQVDVDLPRLNLECASKPLVRLPPEHDMKTNRTYHIYECDLGEVQVNGEVTYRVTCQRALGR